MIFFFFATAYDMLAFGDSLISASHFSVGIYWDYKYLHYCVCALLYGYWGFHSHQASMVWFLSHCSIAVKRHHYNL